MQTLVQDIRYAIRSLIKRPGFLAIAVLTLAFGIGANTAIFTVVNAVLLRPLSFPESEKIVMFEGVNPSRGITQSNMSIPDFVDWQNQSKSFEQMAGFVTTDVVLLTNNEPERVPAALVTADFFPLFRTPALKGRVVQADDIPEDRPPVMVLSYALWQRQFGGRDDVVGSNVTLNNRSRTVIGVMPPGFDFPARVEVWVAYRVNAATVARNDRYLSVVTRLKQGVTIEQAKAEMNTINDRLAQSYSDTNRGWSVGLSTLQNRVVGDVRSSLLILLAAVAFVLLIACANVANLQLARATFRQKEIAVRSALGASRLRIVRQLLTESVLISVVSGAIGLALSIWLTRLLISISPPNSPRFEEIGIDARVFGFAFAIAILTGIVFGLFPALRTSRTDLNETLKESGRTGVDGKRNRIGSALMISEIALSFMLLVGAGLLIKSFIRLREVNPGFSPDHTLTMRVSLPPRKYQSGEPRAQIYKQLVERVQNVPGVSSAGVIMSLPLGADDWNVWRTVVREGTAATRESAEDAMYLPITPGYFDAVKIPLKSGRKFTDQDTGAASKVIIVNEALARRLWPGESPVGRRISINEDFFREIVGVVGDTRSVLDTEPGPQMYVPYAQDATWDVLTLVVRTTSEPTALAATIREAIRSVDSGIPIFNLRTLDDVIATSAAPRRTPMLLLSAFAAAAMLLAMLGIYGVTAYYVTHRTHEIGVRIALGAQLRDVMRLVLMRGFVLAAVGIGIGVAGAFALTRYLRSLLFNVPPVDIVTFVIVAVILVFVALLACVIPARRASKVDPLVALRYE